jgi:superfamily I DNA/RNA helicase
MSKQWSKQQKRIFKAVVNTTGNIIIQAAAGSGKSTTAFAAIRYLCEKYPHTSVLFLSFNKEIQLHAEKKLEDVRNCKVYTFHGYGIQVLRETGFIAANGTQIETGKVGDYIFGADCRVDFNFRKHLFGIVTNIRQHGIMTYEVEDLEKIFKKNWSSMLQFGINKAEVKKISQRMMTVSQTLKALDKKRDIMDFDDMCRFPLLYNSFKELKKSSIPDVVVVDEVQDMNSYNLGFIKWLMKRGARVIAVGDENQAIYEFRGAHIDSMQRVQRLIRGKEFPLSTTYRCRSRIVSFAKAIYNERFEGPVPEITAHKEGGKVIKIYGSDEDPYRIDRLLASQCQMIVSPKNKHLMRIWLTLFARKVPCSLKGSKITGTLSTIMRNLQNEGLSFEQALNKLRTLIASEETKENVRDLAQCTLDFCISFKLSSFEQAQSKLKEIAQYDKGIKLHTVHSSKGLESDRVWLIDDFFDSEQIQCMTYVGMTRAAKRLYFASLGQTKAQKRSVVDNEQKSQREY